MTSPVRGPFIASTPRGKSSHAFLHDICHAMMLFVFYYGIARNDPFNGASKMEEADTKRVLKI